jgi:hypothetical protein
MGANIQTTGGTRHYTEENSNQLQLTERQSLQIATVQLQLTERQSLQIAVIQSQPSLHE